MILNEQALVQNFPGSEENERVGSKLCSIEEKRIGLVQTLLDRTKRNWFSLNFAGSNKKIYWVCRNFRRIEGKRTEVALNLKIEEHCGFASL
jgi:hypothetical protein